MDELVQKTREAMEPTWDEMREARVLSRILEQVEREDEEMGGRTQAFRVSKPGQKRQLWWAGAAVAIAAAASLIVWNSQPSAPPTPVQAASVSPTVEDLPAGVSEIVFSKGTRARLAPGAQVETLEKTGQVIELRQMAGRVTYEVDPARGFKFRVHARDVLVEVVGTVFEVNLDVSSVEVQVTRGVVQVTEGDREVQLKAGDDLRISTSEPEIEEPESERRKPTPAEVVTWLMSRADKARRAKDWPSAASSLKKVIEGYPNDERSLNAMFTLGRVERAQGNHDAAVEAFRAVQKQGKGSALLEDALAEEAISLAQGGNFKVARQRARMYQARFPTGPHAGRLSKLLK